MPKRSPLFAILFALIAITDLYFIYTDNHAARIYTKPLLLPLLMIYYLQQVGAKGKFQRIMLAALFFSWAGDVLLLWDSLFIPGLVAFLTAHIFYIIYFLNVEKGKKGFVTAQPLYAVPILIYWGLFLAFLFPYLDQLRIPVVVYATVICTMLTFSINLWGKLKRPVFLLFVNGALQFVLSDSFLAIHKFVYPFWFLPLAIMITYASAQYLLVRGSVRQLTS